MSGQDNQAKTAREEKYRFLEDRILGALQESMDAISGIKIDVIQILDDITGPVPRESKELANIDKVDNPWSTSDSLNTFLNSGSKYQIIIDQIQLERQETVQALAEIREVLF